MWVKICGTTNQEDAEAAVDAGADAVGFVFAAGPRQVTVARAGQISFHLPKEVERYGVFVHPSFAEVVEAVQGAALTGVQLHAYDDASLPEKVCERFRASPDFRLLQVVHLSPGEEALGKWDDGTLPHADGVLVEARSHGAHGGTGLRFDWQGARELFSRAGRDRKLIVAGGLAPDNVADAIRILRPWGVDVVTGVEREPGRKDAGKVRAFVKRARNAAKETESQEAGRSRSQDWTSLA